MICIYMPMKYEYLEEIETGHRSIIRNFKICINISELCSLTNLNTSVDTNLLHT